MVVDSTSMYYWNGVNLQDGNVVEGKTTDGPTREFDVRSDRSLLAGLYLRGITYVCSDTSTLT